MKLGFTTGNREGRPGKSTTLREEIDRFVNFTWRREDGLVEQLQFFNQGEPAAAIRMLRKMADTIEKSI